MQNNTHRTGYKQYFLPIVDIKDYNVMTARKRLFDQPVKNDRRTYGNVRKSATDQRYNYTKSYLLHHVYFIKYYKIIVIE